MLLLLFFFLIKVSLTSRYHIAYQYHFIIRRRNMLTNTLSVHVTDVTVSK